MKANGPILIISLLIGTAAPAVYAQLEVGGSPLDSCAKIDALQKAGKLNDARDMANQCLQGIEQKMQGQVGQYFKQEVAGWKRTSFDQNIVLGFANISATYAKNKHSVDVSLTRGTGGNESVGGGLGKLFGGLARAGLASSGKQVRVGGLPATVQQDGTLMVTLEDNSFLSFKGADFNDVDSALSGMGDLVNAFPVADINKTLKTK
ncbi:MAG TPA: hypothetical protein VFY39_12825 [Gammaproteobacteria bacterium]|nr:hypothetical protein [Gammaproteobacteria bacterium]